MSNQPKRDMITAERLREALDYDSDTGLFTWRVDRYSGKNKVQVSAGEVAGCCNSDGYRWVGIDSRRYTAHRLAWLWMTGRWPTSTTLI